MPDRCLGQVISVNSDCNGVHFRNKFSTLLWLILLCGSAANAVSPDEALASKFRAAAALMDTQMTLDAVPGAAIGIVHDQELIWSHQYGVESHKTGTAVSDDTLFSICSVSKLFNGVATMNLVEEVP